MSTAQRLEEWLTDTCRNQAAVARKAGYRKSTFNEMVKGKRKITADDIQRICAAVKEPVATFIRPEDDQ